MGIANEMPVSCFCRSPGINGISAIGVAYIGTTFRILLPHWNVTPVASSITNGKAT